MDTDKNRFLRGSKAHEALAIIDRLCGAGFVAYLAGGCVRDALLGRMPKDYDVATDAAPESVREVFGRKRTIAFGASFGVIGVLPPYDSLGGESESPVVPTEVATFRSDGNYSDGRRPDTVHYGDAENDALRRDFTINGLFYDPHSDNVIDYVDGRIDLGLGVLRTIGDPLQRFGEDKLRMLRAVRFATTLGFKMEPTTRQAIIEHADDISVVSGERIGAEMRRVLVSNQGSAGIGHLIDCGLQRVVLPEVETADLGRFERLSGSVEPRSFPLVLACLMSVMEDPQASLSAVSKRWRLSNEELRQTKSALQNESTILAADRLPWSAVQPTLVDRDAALMVQFAQAVAAADGISGEGVSLAIEALSWPTEKLDPAPLLTGSDLREIGIPVGPQYSSILRTLRDRQLDGAITTRAEAIQSLQQ